jgi:lipoprotein-releasing system permease protein
VYKVLLCWRYLLTRYLAFACIISVMLGVATLIVVNSVMSGFSTKLRDRLHGLISDIVVEAISLEGFADAEEKMDRIRKDPVLGPRVDAMAVTMDVMALMSFDYPNGETFTRPVRVIGIDAHTRTEVGGFATFLADEKNRANPSFELAPEVKEAWIKREQQWMLQDELKIPPPGDAPPPSPPRVFQPKIPAAAFVGHLIATYRKPVEEGKFETVEIMKKNDTMRLAMVSGGKTVPVYDLFIIKDYFKSDMSEYDSNLVFVDLKYLQKLRATPDRVTTLQIKLKDFDADSKDTVDRLRMLFAGEMLNINTWEDKQGALLAAIEVERKILNVLLFMIVAVAGFGILAIFSMIVAEKTRDIGIMKALGASHLGVMEIFLSYGLLLGVVGAGLGTMLGIYVTNHLNEIEAILSAITGRKVFSGEIYYFQEIPTNVETGMLIGVNLGAIFIAVVFSVLPAFKAAMLQPVRALRYE